MDIGIGKVYKQNDKYRFILSSKDGQKGYESDCKSKAIKARAHAVKTLKSEGHKIYQLVN